jgi:hypothetical protein
MERDKLLKRLEDGKIREELNEDDYLDDELDGEAT